MGKPGPTLTFPSLLSNGSSKQGCGETRCFFLCTTMQPPTSPCGPCTSSQIPACPTNAPPYLLYSRARPPTVTQRWAAGGPRITGIPGHGDGTLGRGGVGDRLPAQPGHGNGQDMARQGSGGRWGGDPHGAVQVSKTRSLDCSDAAPRSRRWAEFGTWEGKEGRGTAGATAMLLCCACCVSVSVCVIQRSHASDKYLCVRSNTPFHGHHAATTP